MRPYVFGVDLGGTTVKIGFFRTDGTLLENWEIPTRTEEGGKYILTDIKDAIDDCLDRHTLSAADVEGIGMGVPGPVLEDGTVLKCVNLGWGVFNAAKDLYELTDIPVRANNDANIAALGEMWQGGGKGFRNVVLVTLGTGVGGGIIVNGEIVNGANGAGGEIGHIHVKDDETEYCNCGNQGCMEQYASATGSVHVAKMYLRDHPELESGLRNLETITAKDIFDFARAGEPAARAIAADICSCLGKGLASIACVTNPECFVIGGGMSKAGEILIDGIQRQYRKYAFHAAADTEFRLATLGNSAGIYGGAKLVIR